ncbi:MAG TPA: helix-turn-helix domain-containing protein [Ornithinicoccus sp.]|nr:helix-turn-helix domain-containing protein [Ornithinicoccus sp.]
MTSARPGRITDPERIRALAHPLRLELLDYLGDVPEATATECAERTGESVASCSFHLRMLEKYGFIERAEPRGREKPWRVVSNRIDARPDPDVPGSLTAVREQASVNVAGAAERINRFLARADEEPPEWVRAVTITRSSFWATAEEMAQLSRDLQEIAHERFGGRSADASLRPQGARFARLFAAVYPEAEEQR